MTHFKVNSYFEVCCKQGAVILPLLQNSSDLLQNLLIFTDTVSKKFRKLICQYNAAFAFTFVNCNHNKQIDNQQKVTSFSIHEELYHLQSLLKATEGNVSQYA